MCSHTRTMQINPPDDWLKTGWTQDSQVRTRLVDSLHVLYHVFPRKQYILCSLVLFSLLPYITLCYIDMEIFSGDLIT